ncbi:MAG: hypothetical protein CBC78_000745 [Candidatus Pelagibacter sp. TMED118]|nr:MAG: hypothetical protein CBC78_000745 [Candidatus Pelagibacter sp. TMED118]|tara:strand:+ start:1239 stop:2090 length:852 start_codon:yes stop_codon:yes gene_type:complete
MKKIVLGTANLYVKYGLSNFKHKKKFFSKKIINQLIRSKIKFIDTSPNYRSSLDADNFKKFEVITKIKLPKKNSKIFINNLEEKIKIELKKNRKENFYAILFHNSKDLYSKFGKTFLKKIKFLKKKKYFKKIGISIYDPKELKKIFNLFKPEIVQFPINIFDQRMVDEGALDYLKKRKIITQARSIFLQGLLLKKGTFLNKKVNKCMSTKINKFQQWCDNKKISQLDACVSFIKQTKKIDLVTVGFENLKQINQIISSFKKEKKIEYKELYIRDKNIIDPRKW